MRGSQKGQLLCAAVFMLFALVRGATVTSFWVIDYSLQTPDCVNKLVISVNGSYPGPTINATVGDTIVVNVKNEIPTEGVTIHWHGILQAGTPWADGAAFVSQCPIYPGETYTYTFTVTQAGTYFYHGHNGMQRAAGFYGSLIVNEMPGTPKPFTYDEELSILLNDWWHTSMYDQELGLYLKGSNFQWVGDPRSLLIEGRGAYNCSLVPGPVAGAGADWNTSGDCVTCNASKCAPHILPVEAGKTYRLRIASVASLSSLNFILEDHSMTVVEAAGQYVEPVVVQNLDIYSGETYSVLFTANQNSSRNYWAGVNVRGRNQTTPPGLAVLNYITNPSTSLPTTPPPVSPPWNFFNVSVANAQAYKAHHNYTESPPNRTADRQLFLLHTQNTFKGGIKWAINNISYVPTTSPVLGALKYNVLQELVPTPPDSLNLTGYNISNPPNVTETTTGSGLYIFKLNDVVDVVLQNANMLHPGVSEIHPWHLHGHDFWVLGYGLGVFDPNSDNASLNYQNPPKLNTAPVFPWGWTALRFIADNPGAWPFHCHVEPHFHMGMGVIFAEGVDIVPAIPAENLGCGLSKNLIRL